MSAFMVSEGALLEVGCPSTLDRETEQQVSFRTTFSRKRKAFIRRGGRRAWSINVSVASPAEVSTIEAVARDLGPVGWYGPEAVIGNLLSPQASGFDPAPANTTAAGLVQLPDGTIAASVASSTTVQIGDAHGTIEMVPVRPGQPVTVGAWGNGGARMQGRWLNAIGSSVGTYISPPDTHTGWQWREYTFTPPVGAAYLDVQLFAGTAYALPSVTWGTTAARELGTGCPKAIIHSPRFSPLALTTRANYTDSSYSVTEVG